MRTALTLAAVIYGTLSFAQIPNGDFNQWTSDQPYGNPISWITTNAYAATFGVGPTCERGEPGSDGLAFAKVVNRATAGGVVLQGTIVSGDSGKYGFPFDQRPTTFSGRCQYGLSQYDVAQVKVSLTKWDPIANHSYTVGFGSINFIGTSSQWQSFSANLTYNNSNIPDTAVVTVTAGASQLLLTDGSFLQVDELKFGFIGAGVGEVAGAELLSLRPSSVTDRMEVHAGKPLKSAVVNDASGKRVARFTLSGQQATLQLGDLSGGRYFMEVLFRDGSSAIRSFIKE